MNKAILIGTLGADPEIKQAGNSTVAIMSLATTRKWKDKDGNPKEDTQWHTVVAWEKVAGIFEKYTKKGSKVMVEGEIQYREYTNKSGEKKKRTEIRVESLELLSPAPNKGENRTSVSATPSAPDNDLPF